ncbi:hypothetical protein PCASD_15011 [Puccinia coronata f. sp. avenae]|uniref:No apical meristem-associated C-terminal domain-containing protein n=1 Tax=Puccinia coronata f. sp. avenae TaxID=200324 RepID=A0A2N5T990_9BASI|nr:hypothetical protein PCASD_15011 [Puccinia coronata f. sp. avenae]
MKDKHFNAKKMKVLADRASNYCERTLQIQKTNKIGQQIARAEANHVNMEIMKQSEDDLPNDLAREFLQLQKQSIINDLRAQMKEKQAGNQPMTSTSNDQQELPTSSVPPSDQAGFDLSSNAGDLEENGDFEAEIDPSLS